MQNVPFYKKHIFFCTNKKEGDSACCQNHNAAEMCNYAREKLKSLDAHGPQKIRVSNSGCLGRCAMGPNILVYPEGRWCTYKTKEDIDQLIHELMEEQ